MHIHNIEFSDSSETSWGLESLKNFSNIVFPFKRTHREDILMIVMFLFIEQSLQSILNQTVIWMTHVKNRKVNEFDATNDTPLPCEL